MSYADDNFISIDYEDMMLIHSNKDTDLISMQEPLPASEILWECKNGHILSLAQMTTDHIKNCIAMIKCYIKKGIPWRIEYLNPLQRELNKRQENGNI